MRPKTCKVRADWFIPVFGVSFLRDFWGVFCDWPQSFAQHINLQQPPVSYVDVHCWRITLSMFTTRVSTASGFHLCKSSLCPLCFQVFWIFSLPACLRAVCSTAVKHHSLIVFIFRLLANCATVLCFSHSSTFEQSPPQEDFNKRDRT